jgi:predicted transcriptional regulator
MTTPLRPSRPTKLETFIQAYRIKPIDLARESEYSRQHILRIRKGRMEPTRPCIAALVRAARRLSRHDVTAAELFDLE